MEHFVTDFGNLKCNANTSFNYSNCFDGDFAFRYLLSRHCLIFDIFQQTSSTFISAETIAGSIIEDGAKKILSANMSLTIGTICPSLFFFSLGKYQKSCRILLSLLL